MADCGSCRRGLCDVAGGHLLVGPPAALGPAANRGVDHRLAHEPAARKHPRPPHSHTLDQQPDRPMAAGALAALRELPTLPSGASPRRAPDRSPRRSRILLLETGGLG